MDSGEMISCIPTYIWVFRIDETRDQFFKHFEPTKVPHFLVLERHYDRYLEFIVVSHSSFTYVPILFVVWAGKIQMKTLHNSHEIAKNNF